MDNPKINRSAGRIHVVVSKRKKRKFALPSTGIGSFGADILKLRIHASLSVEKVPARNTTQQDRDLQNSEADITALAQSESDKDKDDSLVSIVQKTKLDQTYISTASPLPYHRLLSQQQQHTTQPWILQKTTRRAPT
jgi:hypothetical protein